MKDHFKDNPAVTITEDALLTWRKELLENGSESNAAFFLRHLKTYFQYLEDERKIPRNPLTKRVKIPQPEQPIVIFDDADIDTFFADIKKKDGLAHTTSSSFYSWSAGV